MKTKNSLYGEFGRRPAAIAVRRPVSIVPGIMDQYQKDHSDFRVWREGARMLWYLASPITNKSRSLQSMNQHHAIKALARITMNGYLVYSPAAHWRNAAALYNLPNSWSYWKPLSLEMLRNCHGLLVLQLPGWTASVGVAAEIKFARERGKPVLLLPADGNPDEAIPYETGALRAKRLSHRRSNG